MEEQTTERGVLRTIMVPFAKPGMSLSRAAVTDNSRIIFTTGTTLDEGKIKILRNSFIRYIHVWDDGSWNLPAEAYHSSNTGDAPAEDIGVATTVHGLLSSIQGLNTDLVREKKLGMDALRQAGGKVFSRIQKEPVFKMFLKVDKNANYLFSHMANAAVLGVTVSRSMGLSAKEIWDVFVGGMLMDVGMIQIREDLWMSDKKLTDMQRDEIEKHAVFGYNTIKRAKGAEEAWAIPALEHHERMNGTGYPDKKTGATLALSSRILAVCDVYESLLHERLWRKAFQPDAAILHLLKSPGQFDKDVLGHLAKSVGIYPIGSRVHLSDGRDAEVVGTNAADLLHPIVQVIKGGKVERIDLAATPGLAITAVLARPQ